MTPARRINMKPAVRFGWVLFLVGILAGIGGAAGKKEYRIGIQGGFVYPSSNDMMVKSGVFDTILELDVKRNSRLDTGFRIGYAGLAANTQLYIANYDVFHIGYGARFYLDDRFSPETAFHKFKRYFRLDGNVLLASKYLNGTPNAPSNLYGLGARFGAGLEYVFGPLSSGFVDAEYSLVDMRTSDNAYNLPYSGFVLGFGIRLAR